MSSTSLSARQAIREPRSSLSQRISTRASSSCELLAALQPSYVLQSTSTNGDAMFLTFREQVEKLLTEALEKCEYPSGDLAPVSYTHLRAHETRHDLVCRLLLEKKKKKKIKNQ